MKPHSVAVVVTIICFLFLWVGKLHEIGLKWRAGGETVSKGASCPPYIGVFDFFFFTVNSEWQSSATSVCHGGGYILLSTGLGFGAGDIFSRKRLKAQFQECFWGVGMFYYMGKGW